MGKEMMYQNKKRITYMLIAVIGIFLIYSLLIGGRSIFAKINEQKADELLAQITYTEKTANEEMIKIQDFLFKNYLSTETKGKLYKALAELSYMTGDDMIYNKYVATALFYLEENGDSEDVAYLTNKYIGRLYANGCYEDAKNLLQSLADKYDISKFPLEMQASYYLSRADIKQMLDEEMGDYLEEANAAILLLPESKEKQLNKAKHDMLLIRQQIIDNKWKEAKEGLSAYSEEDSFGYEQDQVYVIVDFKIAYEELMAKTTLHDGNMEDAEKYIETYMKLCDEFQFRAMQLNLLKYVNQQTAIKKSDKAGDYVELEKNLLQRNLSEITNEYAQILLSDMLNTRETLKLEQKSIVRREGYLLFGVMVLALLVLLRTMLSILWDYLNRDGLTKLNNRKKYEIIRLECDKKKAPYGFLIIDIDDFKKVNDTLGHDKGDAVLSGISQILLRYVGKGIYAFRYGGEEMCMMFVRVKKERVIEIAEEIRETIQNTKFVEGRAITISGGVAMSEHGENIFVSADRKLYEAKEAGKNQIRS